MDKYAPPWKNESPSSINELPTFPSKKEVEIKNFNDTKTEDNRIYETLIDAHNKICKSLLSIDPTRREQVIRSVAILYGIKL